MLNNHAKAQARRYYGHPQPKRGRNFKSHLRDSAKVVSGLKYHFGSKKEMMDVLINSIEG